MTTDVLVTLDLAPHIIERIAAVDASLCACWAPGRASFVAASRTRRLRATTPRAEGQGDRGGDILLLVGGGAARPRPACDRPRLRWVLLHAGAERVNPALTGDVLGCWWRGRSRSR
jgi:hypothetical protein